MTSPSTYGGDVDATGGLGEAAVLIAGGRSYEDRTVEKTSVSGPRHTGTFVSWGDCAANIDASIGASSTEVGAASALPVAGSRRRIQQAFTECKVALECALESGDDLIAKANALTDFSDALAVLWTERPHRERQFSLVVNRLQTMMVEMDLENVSEDKLRALRSVVSSAAAAPQLTNSDVRFVSSTLAKAGCDVFTGFRSPN